MISPFAVQEFSNCPRQRWFSRIADGGSEPARLSIKDAVDKILKPALSRLIANRAFEIETHVVRAMESYQAMLAEYSGLALLPTEDAIYVQEEIGALIEALVRAADRVIAPDFEHAQAVTMPDKVAYRLSDGVEIEAGPDVLIEYEGGRCGLFWHVVGQNMQPNLWILRHSIVPAVLAFNLDLVEVRYVKRGRRAEGKQGSCLIYSRTLGLTRAQRYKRQKRSDPLSAVWQRLQGGVKSWIDRMPDRLIVEHFGMDWAPVDPTNQRMSQYKYTKNSMTLTQMVSASELQSWRIQVNEQERQIERRSGKIRDCTVPALRAAMIDAYFQQGRQSCDYCNYRPACDQAIVDLQNSGLFRRRA